MATLTQTLPTFLVDARPGLARDQAHLETLLHVVLCAWAAGLATARCVGWRIGRRVTGCFPRRFSVDELQDREAIRAHVTQRNTFARTQADAERRWWKLSRKEAKDIGRLMSQKLGQLGLDYIFSLDGDKVRRFVQFEAVEIGPDQFRYRVNSRKLPRGVNEVEMTKEEVIKGLECTIGKTLHYHLDETGLWYLIDRKSGLRNIPRYVDYPDAYNMLTQKDGPMVVPIGMGQNRAPIKIDFQSNTSAHFLIGGSTGAGKTNLVHCIIATLAKRDPRQVRLVLIDLKQGIEFSMYDKLPHLDCPIVTEPSEVLGIMELMWQEVLRRMTLLRSERGCNHIREYNNRHRKDQMPYVVLVFDEIAVVMLDRTLKHKAEIESFMARIAGTGRATGVHLVLATQRPDKNVLTPLITANFPGRIGLACASVYDSMTVIGNGDACFQEAVPAGRAILSRGRWRTPFQIAFINDNLRRQITDDAEGGRFSSRRMAHDVTIQELAQYALEHFEGNFSHRKLWRQFESRGISSMEVQEIAKVYRNETFHMEDGEYILTAGNKSGSKVLVTKVVGQETESLKPGELLTQGIPVEMPAVKTGSGDDEYTQFCARINSELEEVPSVA